MGRGFWKGGVEGGRRIWGEQGFAEGIEDWGAGSQGFWEAVLRVVVIRGGGFGGTRIWEGGAEVAGKARVSGSVREAGIGRGAGEAKV